MFAGKLEKKHLSFPRAPLWEVPQGGHTQAVSALPSPRRNLLDVIRGRKSKRPAT
jgi:hypothetical protein